MEKIIACCGMDCAACEAYIATVNNDDELREKVAEKWSRMFESCFKPEDINCMGCTGPQGPHVAYCLECPIRKCAIEREIPNCAHCPEFPCAKLNVHLEFVAPGARETLEGIKNNLE
jgi:hypothetical protein